MLGLSEAKKAERLPAFQFIVFVLCNFEFFHIVAHFLVLTRWHLFDNLDDKGWYFLLDGSCALICYLVVLYLHNITSFGIFKHGIILFHIGMHLFYYVPNWGTDDYYADRIMKWSSIGYKGAYFTADWVLTVIDIIVHGLLLFHLSKFLAQQKKINNNNHATLSAGANISG